MEFKLFGRQVIEVKSQAMTLVDALRDQLSNFRNNFEQVAMEIQGDDIAVIRAFSKEYDVNIILKHSDGFYQGINPNDSRKKLKVLEAGNEYFSVSKSEALKKGNLRKRKWEKTSKGLFTPKDVLKHQECNNKYVQKHREHNKTKMTTEKEISGTGLKNLSNFCYGNSVIQALLPFRDIFKEKPCGNLQLPIIVKMESVSKIKVSRNIEI